MRKYESPDIKITYFATDDTMTDPTYPPEDPISVINVLGLEKEKVQVGSIDFQSLK